MVKALAPILHGKELTPEEIKFEEEMCYGLMICLELSMFEKGSNFMNQMKKQAPGSVVCCLTWCTCSLVCFRRKMLKSLTTGYNIPNSNCDKYIAMIEERLSKHTYL
jgi:hypothetical protein